MAKTKYSVKLVKTYCNYIKQIQNVIIDYKLNKIDNLTLRLYFMKMSSITHHIKHDYLLNEVYQCFLTNLSALEMLT